jgi:acetoacetyl-CoA synthetase
MPASVGRAGTLAQRALRLDRTGPRPDRFQQGRHVAARAEADRGVRGDRVFTLSAWSGGHLFPVWPCARSLPHDISTDRSSPFGSGLQASARAGLRPAATYVLSALRILGATGSVLPAGSYHWASEHVGRDVAVASSTGGTDIVSAFAGWAPTVPVWPGEISAPALGVALEAWDSDGRTVREEVGELVVTQPMPSMPLYFWDDPDGQRYRSAYFDHFPGVWRHGDWITITERGSVRVHGRSDSTLNRHGVRMGSADIYQAIETIPEVEDSLVIGAEQPDGGYWMPLFVVLADGVPLTDDLADRIRAAIRETASPRHVPDEIIPVAAVPRTRTGKKLEVPIKRLMQGAALADVIDPQTVVDTESLKPYVAIAEARNARR